MGRLIRAGLAGAIEGGVKVFVVPVYFVWAVKLGLIDSTIHPLFAISMIGLSSYGLWIVTDRMTRHVTRIVSGEANETGTSYQCPCCRYPTLLERGGYEICPVCFWEDDGQGDHDADVVRGGPNSDLSLSAARENYKRYGAADPKWLSHVRQPTEEEAAG